MVRAVLLTGAASLMQNAEPAQNLSKVPALGQQVGFGKSFSHSIDNRNVRGTGAECPAPGNGVIYI